MVHDQQKQSDALDQMLKEMDKMRKGGQMPAMPTMADVEQLNRMAEAICHNPQNSSKPSDY